MAQTLLVGLFKEIEDAQTAINEISQAGFLQEISLIAKNQSESTQPEANNEDYESELDGGSGMDEVRGLIDPISNDEYESVEVTIPNIGDMIFAGPIANIVVEENIEQKVLEENLPELEFDKILRSLGFTLDDSTFLENYLKKNYVLIAVPVTEDNKEEINTIFSDTGAELIEETKSEW